MAMPQLGLLFIGALALILTGVAGWLALNANRSDTWTRVLSDVAAALLWGLFGLSAMDVIIRDAAFSSNSEPVWPLVYLGFGAGLIVFLYALYDLLVGVGSEVPTEGDVTP